MVCLTCGYARWDCRCELPPDQQRSVKPSYAQYTHGTKATSEASPSTPRIVEDPNVPEVAPKPEHFGLTEERIRYFEKREFGLSDSQSRWLFWTLCVLAGLYFIDATDSIVLGIFLLWPGLILVGIAYYLLLFVIMMVDNSFHVLSSKVRADYGLYQEYARAVAEYQTRLNELQRQQYLAEEARRKQLEAKRRQEEEEKRKQEQWWKSLDGRTFELELARLLRRRGYKVKLTSPSGDQGVDLFLEAGAKSIVVQCKAHRNYVSPSVVRDLFGTMLHFKADEAWLVTTSGFYSGVREFAQGKPIKLLTISDLVRDESVVERE